MHGSAVASALAAFLTPRLRLAALAATASLGFGACAPPARPAASADAAGEGPAEAVLLEATRRIIAFLRGDETLPPALLADSVTLRVAPGGGGATRTVARERLARRDEWWAGDYSFTPAPTLTELTLRPGHHLRCWETPLESLAPELARLPHVGTQLAPRGLESCLQAWNLTLVFADNTDAPRLVTALYDQWEW